MGNKSLPRDGNGGVIQGVSGIVAITNTVINALTYTDIVAPDVYAKGIVVKTASGKACYISIDGGTAFLSLVGTLSVNMMVSPLAVLFACKGSEADTLEVAFLD